MSQEHSPQSSPHLTLALDSGPDADPEELAELCRRLRDRLVEIDGVNEVVLAQAGDIHIGSKSSLPIDWTTLFVTLAAPGAVLTSVIMTIQTLLRRNQVRSVTLEMGGDKLTVTGLSSEEQHRLINAWLSRHKGFVLPDE